MDRKLMVALALAWVGSPTWAGESVAQDPEKRSELARLAATLKPRAWAMLNKDGDGSGYGLKFDERQL
jgi:hypothetical protein